MSSPPPPLSERARQNSLAGDKWAPLVEALSNVYSDANPDGAVLMGIAENSLMRDELATHIKENLSIEPSSHFTYGHGPQGSPKLRQALANFFNDKFHALSLTQAKDFVITSGCASALDAATFCICNEGEGILVPLPLYTGFTNDIPTRSRGKVLPVSFAREDGKIVWEDVFDADANVRALEAARSKAEAEGTRVKAVLITNPHNPLARCYPVETLQAIASLCAANNLHYISDEIYASSTFSNPSNPDAPPFHPAVSIDFGSDVREDSIHVMYGASKDFGANGLRLGAFYTRNETLRLSMQSILCFAWPSYFTQDIWARSLEDGAWLDSFLETNRKRLGEQYADFTKALDTLGIPYLKGGNATMFAWIDLASYVAPGCRGDEKKKLEGDIAAACKAQGVVIARAAAYQSEVDGWFRVTFALAPKLLQVGMERLFAALEAVKQQRAS